MNLNATSNEIFIVPRRIKIEINYGPDDNTFGYT